MALPAESERLRVRRRGNGRPRAENNFERFRVACRRRRRWINCGLVRHLRITALGAFLLGISQSRAIAEQCESGGAPADSSRLDFHEFGLLRDSRRQSAETNRYVCARNADSDQRKIDIYRQSRPEMESEGFHFVGCAGNARLAERTDGADFVRPIERTARAR